MSELINNRERRIQRLKEIILHLHRGLPPEQVRARLADIVRQTDATEVAAMEQELLADGLSIDEIRSMCDLHSQVLRDVLPVQRPSPLIVPGHPVDVFRRENQAVRKVVEELRQAFRTLAGLSGDAAPPDLLQKCRELVNALFDLEKHYQRKELLLFPFLEKHGITGPSKVMWAKDEEVRALLDALDKALRAEGGTLAEWRVVADLVAAPALAAIEEMIFKEENILLPMSSDALTAEEWGRVWAESPRIGWCLVEPAKVYRPPQSASPSLAAETPPGAAVRPPGGGLSAEQLAAIFSTLPFDLTFVDADDRVAFFSEGPERIFARSRAVIGRQVQHCHPPRSVAIVERILDDFRNRRRRVAEFWIEFHGRFVHIRYFAVHDAGGEYMGCLEVTQDVTQIRRLSGERRLLAYDAAAAS